MSPVGTLAGAFVPPTDTRVRRLGGTWGIISDGYPWANFLEGRSTHYTAQPITGWAPNTSVLEFVLQGDAFEWATLGYGGSGGWTVQVDGNFTSSAGYDAFSNSDGAIRWFKVQLPHSDSPRRIRITSSAKPFGGLQLPADGSLQDPAPKAPSSVVYVGDSITEGAVSTQVWYNWAVQSALRLGIDNYIVSGSGGTGYLTHGGGARFTLRERIEDVLTAVDGGPPDMVVVAAGINDANNYTPAQIGAEALLYFQQLRTAAPDMVIVVLGPWGGFPPYPAKEVAARDAIFGAAAQVPGVRMVDVSDWVTADNYHTVFHVGVSSDGTEYGIDGPHPTDAGHMIYGQRAAAAISDIIRGL